MTSLAVRTVESARTQKGAPLQYLTFTLGTELMAAPITTIREVVEYSAITRIPLSSQCVPGVLNLRGAVVPVVDLSARLGRAPTVLGRRTCIIIVEAQADEGLQLVGMIVDAVSEALEVLPSQIERRPAFGTGLRSDFVEGMLNAGERFVIVVDMAAILSMPELERLVNDASYAGERRASRAPPAGR